MNKEFLSALEAVAKEKSIDKELLIDAACEIGINVNEKTETNARVELLLREIDDDVQAYTET